jgi:hypothetical protein
MIARGERKSRRNLKAEGQSVREVDPLRSAPFPWQLPPRSAAQLLHDRLFVLVDAPSCINFIHDNNLLCTTL